MASAIFYNRNGEVVRPTTKFNLDEFDKPPRVFHDTDTGIRYRYSDRQDDQDRFVYREEPPAT